MLLFLSKKAMSIEAYRDGNNWSMTRMLWLVFTLLLRTRVTHSSKLFVSATCAQKLSLARSFWKKWSTCLPVPQYKSPNPKGILNQNLFRSRLSIASTQMGLLLTVTDISITCAVVIFRVKVSCITSVDGTNLWLLTSVSVRHVLGRLSVKPWCYWIWRLVMSLVRFDRSIVTVKQSFIVSQILGCPVILSLFGLLESVNTVKSFVRCR